MSYRKISYFVGMGMLAASLIVQSPAQAARTYDSAGYCSAYGPSGQWAVWFGEGSIREACRQVRWTLPGPLISKRSGYYSLYGWNRVWVRCLNYRNTFTGVGSSPARQAYNAARWAGGQSCLFGGRALY